MGSVLDKAVIGGGVLLVAIGVIGYFVSGGETTVDTQDRQEQAGATASSTTTTTPSTTATTEVADDQPAVVEERVEDFLAQLTESIKGDRSFAVARLGGATIERYGAAQCQAYVTQLNDDTFDVTVRAVAEPAPWDYTTDELTTPIPDAIPVEVQRVARGETVIQELHLTRDADGTLQWYSDCGDPQ